MTNRFKCNICEQFKDVQTSGGTGYAIDKDGRNICYECCGAIDKADMLKTGRAVLYLSIQDYGRQGWIGERYVSADITNWPGTLKFHTQLVKSGRHNVAGRRYDVWFKGPDGQTWHGVQYGDNTQICHCRRTKA